MLPLLSLFNFIFIFWKETLISKSSFYPPEITTWQILTSFQIKGWQGEFPLYPRYGRSMVHLETMGPFQISITQTQHKTPSEDTILVYPK